MLRGGVYVGNSKAAFTMESGCTGSIIGCVASSEGGGVYVYEGASFTMKSGSIHDCVCPRLEESSYGRGGGVSNHGTFAMTGGKLVDCSTEEGGKGNGILLDGDKKLEDVVSTGYGLKIGDDWADLSKQFCGNVICSCHTPLARTATAPPVGRR